MPSNWSKGLTKATSPSLLKRSETMRTRGLDNFREWRERMKSMGKIKSSYPELRKNGDLAELIGVILGDGHIRKYPRTEELSIFSNANNPGFIKRYSWLVKKIFGKKPAITYHGKNCKRIRIYQKYIQSRLDIPYSPRRDLKIEIPEWILKNSKCVVRYLRGLYEAEGSFCVHLPTSTYKFLFSNRNKSMLKNVFGLMKNLGFNPHANESNHCIQLSKKNDVFQAMKILKFRKY